MEESWAMPVSEDARDEICVSCVSAGSSHTVVLLAGCDAVVTFGRGDDGQLGHGDADERLKPTTVASFAGAEVDVVVCGAEHSVALSKRQKQVYSWGWGDFGRLGHGDSSDVFLPQPIAFFSGMTVSKIACGDTFSLAIIDNGELYSFGRNQNGQLGLGHKEDVTVPARVHAFAGKQVLDVACGAEHTVASTDDGKMYAWGWGRYGNLGDGDCKDRWEPALVLGLEGRVVASVACGWRHSAAVTDQGQVFTFGWSKYGQLGHGDYNDRLKAEEVKALAGKVVVKVSGGWRHTMAADNHGRLYAWGWNKFGQLGLGDAADRAAPVAVEALEGQAVAMLACGWRHTVVVMDSGLVYTWGRGVNGQLGQDVAQDLATPAIVPSLCKGSIRLASLAASPRAGPGEVPAMDRYAAVPHGAADAPPTGTTTVPHVPDAKRRRLGNHGAVPGA